MEDGRKILSNIVSSQSDIHTRYGGIVPELASRRHIEMIMPVVDEAIKQAGISFEDLSAVAVCKGPGLIGSLLIGCSFAKALCYSQHIPLIAVNHLEGHLLSVFLESPAPEFPFLSLIVSGGHTSLHIAEDYGRYIELGRTRDDAAGEAYDKVSKLLGLGYPGGPVIDRLAQMGDPGAIDFPRAYLPESLDFSFSGLKTAVLQFLRKENSAGCRPCPLILNCLHNIAASFQAAVVDVLVRKTEWAVKKKWIKQVTLSGGVSANSGLRKKMLETGERRRLRGFCPSCIALHRQRCNDCCCCAPPLHKKRLCRP